MPFLLLAITTGLWAMRLNTEALRQSIRLTVIQENQVDSHTFDLDPRDTLMHLYHLVGLTTGFDPETVRLYLGDDLLKPTPSPLSGLGLLPNDFMLLKLDSGSPKTELVDSGPKPNTGSGVDKLKRSSSASNLALFSPRLKKADQIKKTVSSPAINRSKRHVKIHSRTPRYRQNDSKVVSFHRLSAEEQEFIREAFKSDIIQSQALTIILERIYPELIQALFYDEGKFFAMMTPELMLKIDEIEEALKASGEYYDKPEEGGPAEDEVSAKDVLHVMASMNGLPLPILFDCIGMDTTSKSLFIIILSLFISELWGLLCCLSGQGAVSGQADC